MTPLTWMGRHASALLLLGLVAVPLLPLSPDRLRPLLPALVVLVTALAIARQPFDPATLRRIFAPGPVLAMVFWLVLSQIGAALLVVGLGRLAGADPQLLLLLAAFFAAAPLGSAPNLCLMLGYDFSLGLRLTLLGTLLAPLLLPATLGLSGLPFDASVAQLALRVGGMLSGGILLGLAIRALWGGARIARNTDILNGLAALAMIAFLFPLLAGSREALMTRPHLVLGLLLLALTLNFGGNLLIRSAAMTVLPRPAARALGLVFGNRNTSVVLASLPFDPLLTLFVAAMQFPIYATPLLFSAFETPCPPSSES